MMAVALTNLSAEDQAIREGRFSASRGGALFGVDPFTSFEDLYRFYIGELPPSPATDPAEWGTLKEDAIAQWCARKMGLRIEKKGTVVHPTIPFLCASIDRLVLGPPDRILEIKATRSTKGWGAGLTQVPPRVLIQVSIQMAVLDLDETIVGAEILGAPPRTYFLERDLDRELRILDAIEDFWTNHVMKRVPPDSNFVGKHTLPGI